MHTKQKIQMAIVFLILLVYVAGQVLEPPSSHEKTLFYVSSYGYLTLLSLIFVLFLPMLVKWKPNHLLRELVVNRRWLGIGVFLFASIHVYLVLDGFFAWSIDAVLAYAGANYILLGALAFLILFLLTATSNDLAMRILKGNWKKLHMFVWLAIALVLVHAFGLGQIYMDNIFVKAITTIAVVYLIVKRFVRIG